MEGNGVQSSSQGTDYTAFHHRSPSQVWLGPASQFKMQILWGTPLPAGCSPTSHLV